jgi:AcrR family transcriptional regulator
MVPSGTAARSRRPPAAADPRERIMDAAEELLRRHGPARATVVDVARALGMSHANVYRHFASKAALRESVAERWLRGISAPLEAVAARPGPAAERLVEWVLALAAAKRRKVRDDPEIFSAYHALAEEHRAVVERHVQHLCAQVRRILEDGVAEGAFRLRDPEDAAQAVLEATLRFHHPAHVAAGDDPAATEAAARRVLALLVAGLAAGAL